LKRAGSGGGLLDERCVLLRHFVHLADCLIDLPDAGTLFVRRSP